MIIRLFVQSVFFQKFSARVDFLLFFPTLIVHFEFFRIVFPVFLLCQIFLLAIRLSACGGLFFFPLFALFQICLSPCFSFFSLLALPFFRVFCPFFVHPAQGTSSGFFYCCIINTVNISSIRFFARYYFPKLVRLYFHPANRSLVFSRYTFFR